MHSYSPPIDVVFDLVDITAGASFLSLPPGSGAADQAAVLPGQSTTVLPSQTLDGATGQHPG